MHFRKSVERSVFRLLTSWDDIPKYTILSGVYRSMGTELFNLTSKDEYEIQNHLLNNVKRT